MRPIFRVMNPCVWLFIFSAISFQVFKVQAQPVVPANGPLSQSASPSIEPPSPPIALSTSSIQQQALPSPELVPISPVVNASVARWHLGRRLYFSGTGLKVVSTSFSIAGGVAASRQDVPLELSRGFVYTSLGVGVGGFSLAAAGMHQQHRAMTELGMPQPLGLYRAGISLGAIGLTVGVVSCFLYGFNVTPQPAVSGVSFTSTLLSTIGSIVQIVDTRRMARLLVRQGLL